MTMQAGQGADLLQGVYQTPLDLLLPINRRWPICFDLAAHPNNQVVQRLGGRSGYFYSEAEDALLQSWTKENRNIDPRGFCWLNPPFDSLGRWTKKAEVEASKDGRFIMLLPAATGAAWLEPCRRLAQIVFLVGRPVFGFLHTKSATPDKNGNIRYRVGDPNTDPYPKDLLLAVFGEGTGVSWWKWKP